MQNNYEVGKTYDLPVAGTIFRDGSMYIVVKDEEREYTVRPYDYQMEYSSYPSVLTCYVRKIGFTGLPYFEQSKESALKDRYYQLGDSHQFVVTEIQMDTNTGKQFYILSDEYGIQHRYYPVDGEELKRRGESITLIVRSVVPAKDGKNNARLDLVAPGTDKKTHLAAIRPVYPQNEGKKNFGFEDEQKEFKSSIVFPAGEITPDIDKQLGIICRTIAGFMNAKGGTLYIGVSDNGYICGIESDYSHLNEGEDDFPDKPNNYKPNDDCYLQKITNRLCSLLGRTAGTLVSMDIIDEDGKKYCKIEIKKASRPIWFSGNKLFVRMVTTNRKLFGDEITQFVLDRVSKGAFVKQTESEVPVEISSSSEEESGLTGITSVAVPETKHNASKDKNRSKAWRYISFYNNGEWSFQKNELQGEDVVCTAAVPSDAKQNNHILVIAYENGHIEATYLKKVLYGKNGLLPEGKRRGQGLCIENGKVVAVFCVHKKDMLLLKSEVAGDTFVKAMDVDTLGIHDKMGKGNGIVREKGGVLVNVIPIPYDEGARVSLMGSGIFIEKNQKYTKGGVKLITLAPNYRQLIAGFIESVK
ncbi:MAG: ATP-binding protein [Paludibacteraceae bacterium]|nr:ATP-binding protein [Paludibacteraceae bacterium]